MRNRNLSVAWTDYQKAFDSVPHSCVENSIELIEVTTVLKFGNRALLKYAGKGVMCLRTGRWHLYSLLMVLD